NRHRRRFIDGRTVNGFAHHHLCRLLLHLKSSAELKSFLVLGEEERIILRELSQFVLNTQTPTPFDLPDASTDNILDGEHLAGGLLNFSPPDVPSIATVRAHPQVKHYASRVRPILEARNSPDTQRALVHAMREAMEQSEIKHRVHTIFEVESWVW